MKNKVQQFITKKSLFKRTGGSLLTLRELLRTTQALQILPTQFRAIPQALQLLKKER